MILKTLIFPVFVVLFLHTKDIKSARILAFFPSPVKSHLIIHTSLTQVLAERGHNITLITNIPLIKQNQNYSSHIQLNACSIPKDYFNDKINKGQPFYTQFIEIMHTMKKCFSKPIDSLPKMTKLMAEEKFDLVILGYFFNDFQIGLAAHFKCPIVLSFMVQPIRQINQFIGNPMEIAYVPNLLSGYDQPMNFWQRLKNFILVEIFEPIVIGLFMTDLQKTLYENNFPPNKYPSLDDVKKNISLVLVNHHHLSQGPIRPNVPGLVEIGGIQIKEKPDPLPEDIKSIMDSATNGLIYFSFGSNIQGDVLDRNKVKTMFDILSKLPYTILWKWGKLHLPGNAANVIYKTWLPQDDVLAHPNLRLFITHGGQGSIVESLYHGVPMVGVPLFSEQHANVANMEKKGYGRLVEFTTMTKESFGSAVNDVLNNSKYRSNVERFARIYKDRPMSAKETAVFWVEYVLRHRGAPHMQSPAVHLNKFQLMSLDVVVFLIVVVYLVLRFVKMFLIYIYFKYVPKRLKNKKE